MVCLQLSIRAELENVTNLQPADPDNFEWFFTVKCTSCNEVHPKPVSINRLDSRSLGKGSSANFVWRCGNCKREASANVNAPTASALLTYTLESSSANQFSTLAILDCRGLEFTHFHPEGTWMCVGVESGIVFNDVDLAEDDWTDYDEKSKLPVGISKLESRLSRAA